MGFPQVSVGDEEAGVSSPEHERLFGRGFGVAGFAIKVGEGRKRAMERGVKFGRPPALNAYQRSEALARLAAGDSQADVARSYRVDPATVCRLAASLA
jgi:hypothetical protein